MSAPSTPGRLGFRPLALGLTAAGVLAAATLTGAAQGGAPVPAGRPLSVSPAAATATAPLVDAVARPTLRHSTYLGGRFWDEATDVKGDASGATYVAGFTVSPDFPVRHAVQPRFAGGVDVFVAKLAPGGGSILWSTFLGGRDLDVATGLAVDAAGNAYVTGRTGSVDYPTTRGTVQPTIRGRDCQQGEACHDAFVTKLSRDGRIVYSTFLGGSANEEGGGITVDASGAVVVTGNTDSRDFPTRAPVQGSFQSPPCRGDVPCPYDVFVSKLTPDGHALAYSTYLGGHGLDQSGGVAVDRWGNAYVTGTTRSVDFPVRGGLGSPLHVRRCGPPPGTVCLDAFVTKLGPRGALVYSTFLGGTKNERGSGIGVDAAGSAIVTGSTQSSDFPVRRAMQGHIDNSACTAEEPEEKCDDGFVSKLAPSGRELLWSTFLTGRAEDQGLSLAVDTHGNAFVGGRTDSRNFRVRDAVQPRFGGYIDGFARSLTSGGALRWSTFVGGREADRVEGIAVDAHQRIRLAGRTLSPDLRTRNPIQGHLHDEDYDAFVAVLG